MHEGVVPADQHFSHLSKQTHMQLTFIILASVITITESFTPGATL
jgi:hypothetical protein